MQTFIAILYMIGTILVHQFEAIFIKKYNSKHSDGGYIFTAIVSLFSMFFFLAKGIFNGGFSFSLPVVIQGIIAGVFYCLASVTTYMALETGSFGLTKLFMSYGILIPIVQGFWLGEKCTPLQIVGIILILVAIFCFKGKKSDETVNITKTWVIYISTTILGAGIYGILQRNQQILFKAKSTNEFMVTALLTSAVILFVFAIIKQKGKVKSILKNCIGYAALAGVANGLTNALTLIVFLIVPLTYSTPVKAGLGIIYSFLFSLFMFKEKFSKRQIVGVVLSIIAIILMKL